MTWLLRVLLLVLAFLAGRMVLSHWVRSRVHRRIRQAGGTRPTPRSVGATAVKDPVCGTYVDPQLALVLEEGAERRYFCSPECRDTYRRHAGTGAWAAGRVERRTSSRE
ncbi:MAG: hypothetical protein Kow00109_21320 [Acidobacteriota bacterium]